MNDLEDKWPIEPGFLSSEISIPSTEKVQRLMDSFAYLFKVKLVIISTRMEELAREQQNPPSPFCSSIRKKLGFTNRCFQQDKLMCECCRNQDKVIVYKCYAGPMEVAVPIKIRNNIVGYAMMGQFRTGNELPAAIIREWEKEGFSREELQKNYEALPLYDETAMDKMVQLFSMMITFFVSKEYMRFRHLDVTERVLKWIDEHINGPLNLDDAVKEVGYSRSVISHTIKQQLGMSFKKICNIKQVERFESILSADPFLLIQEAAAMVGYEDSLHFSRIYKKIRSGTPSAFVKSLKEKAEGVAAD